MASENHPSVTMNQSFFSFFLVTIFFFFLLSGDVCRADGFQGVPAIYVFGDSLVDVGNNNYLPLSLAKANFPHNGVDFPGKKATGRFSNGKNAADFIAEKLGLPTSPPYLANRTSDFHKGVSFASGGAGIFNGTNELFGKSITLSKQLEYYSSVHDRLMQRLGSNAAQEHLSKSVFSIVIGSNDLFGYFNPGSATAKTYTPQQFTDLMISDLQTTLKRLHDQGGRKFLITGVGTIGCCPKQRSQNKTKECNEEINYWSKKYNDGLKLMLQALKSQLKDINYSYFDTYKALQEFIQKPSDYGFVEIKSACCGLGNLRTDIPCIPISEYCSNRSDHLFWDLYHPTETVARRFVDYIYSGTLQYTTPMNLKQLVDA